MNDSDLRMAVKQLIDYYEKHRVMMEADGAVVVGDEDAVDELFGQGVRLEATSSGAGTEDSEWTALIDFTEPISEATTDGAEIGNRSRMRKNNREGGKESKKRGCTPSTSGSEATVIDTNETYQKG